CLVLGEKKLAELKMNAMLAVGRASATPPRLIILEHRGARPNDPPIVLIGKAVTFDTGGYSLKSAGSITDMKYDKCGGMAVLGVMAAAARTKVAARIVGVIAAAENAIDRDAYRPDDIITAMNGKTIEVVSTDAEGRLVLADALCYVQKYYRPRVMIDLATLTGACVIALGHHAAALFSNDEDLTTRLIRAADGTGERLWRMPLWPAYRKQIKGADADIKNTGGRAAGAVTAAMFLREFVDKKTAWAHLDIAGVAYAEQDSPLCPKGATGFGVRLLMQYLSEFAGDRADA
ncbi:MAG: leucyl aminopeptidase, partial [Phycisphaerae bacterium]